MNQGVRIISTPANLLEIRKKNPTLHKQIITRGDVGSTLSQEDQVCELFDRALRANKIPYESEVPGVMRGNLNGKDKKKVRADRIIYPTEAMLENGYIMGPAIVELKGAGQKLMPCIAQVHDYRLSRFYPRNPPPLYMKEVLPEEQYLKGYLEPTVAYIYPESVWANQGSGEEHLSISGGAFGSFQNQWRVGRIHISGELAMSFWLGDRVMMSTSPGKDTAFVAEEKFQLRGLRSGSR